MSQIKLAGLVGYHNKGEPYPQIDFSELKGLDLSWVRPSVCLTNEQIQETLEKQYSKNPKLTRGEYFYYLIHKEDKCQTSDSNGKD